MRERARTASPRRFLMCPPVHFAVEYAINPWMDPGRPVDRDLALRQWDGLVGVLRGLGHSVEQTAPEPGLPDMVFAANAAVVVDGRVLVSRFRYPQRAAESAAYRRWFESHGFEDVRTAGHVNEGQGDVLAAGRLLLAGKGFRTCAAAHREAGALFGLPVVPLRLVDPRFYHLDTALAVLDGSTVAYHPGAFDGPSRVSLRTLFPDAVTVGRPEAEMFALNAVSDGRHVVLPESAREFATHLAERGFVPVGVAMTEFAKAGGGPKCCTLDLHGAASAGSGRPAGPGRWGTTAA